MRFAQTYCSQCGQEQGPGDNGVSHCRDHLNAHVHPVFRDILSGFFTPQPTCAPDERPQPGDMT